MRSLTITATYLADDAAGTEVTVTVTGENRTKLLAKAKRDALKKARTELGPHIAHVYLHSQN